MQERSRAIISFVDCGLCNRILGVRERRQRDLGRETKCRTEEFLPQNESFTHPYGMQRQEQDIFG